MASPPTRTTRRSRFVTGCARILAVFLLAVWLGGANACLVVGSLERALVSLRGRSWRTAAAARAGA